MGILAIARIADNRNNIIGLRLLNTEAGKMLYSQRHKTIAKCRALGYNVIERANGLIIPNTFI